MLALSRVVQQVPGGVVRGGGVGEHALTVDRGLTGS